MEFTVQQIAQLLKGSVQGNQEAKIVRLDKIQEGKEGGISFLANLKYEPFLYTTQSTAVIVNKDFTPQKEIQTTLIFVDDAYSAFSKLLAEYQRLRNLSKEGIEAPSHVADDITMGENVYIGAFTYVGKQVSLGNHVKIYPNSYIGDNVTIGDHTTVHAGVKIYDDCQIGQHCTIHSGAVIGSDGFGFAPQPDGTYSTIPQVGNVLIEDHVSIGANTVVDCATMGATIIKEGAKLDNLIQVAHNVIIGKNTVIAAQTGVSGSTEIGDHCVVGGQVGFVGHLRITNRTTFGAQSGVTKDVKEEGKRFQGTPAFEMGGFQRASVIFKKLPALKLRVDDLEKKLLNLLDNIKKN
ncbi:MAG: UDP-3-O-(3-hydroxymyristoyl)glucosamine N-acyltransferase [Thermonemataceae bacterium]